MKQLITLLILLFSVNSFSQTPAFPSAYGGGAYTTGGRGGAVYHVTNLNDVGTGSFRTALSQPRPATIVFDVSGTIDIQTWLTISGSDLTIAGQTAPIGGITIASTNGSRFRFVNCHNIIMRYIRVRPATQSGDDAFEIWGDNADVYNIILDHCSFSYGGDECASMRGANYLQYNVTFQRLLVAEAKTGSLFGDSGNPGNTNNNSWLSSLFWNISHRTPNISSNGRVDIVNNVIHDWQYRQTVALGDVQLNHINNYYSLGSRTTLPGGSAQLQLNCLDVRSNPKVYTAGNYVDKGILTNPLGDNKVLWCEWYDTITTTYQKNYAPVSAFTNTQYSSIGRPLPVQSATDAHADVITNVGANLSLSADGTCNYYTDTQDSFYLNIMSQGQGANHPYIMNGNWPQPGSNRTWWTEQMYANFVAGVSSTPINTRPAGYDTDNDGMADLWETTTFGNLSRDGSLDLDADGYTDLEEFLNMVDVCQNTTPVNTCTGKNVPSGTISSPLGGSYLKSDTLNFGVSYTSDTTVSSVVYYLNGSLLANTISPFTIDTSDLTQGIYTIFSVLTDECGKSSNTDTVNFTIKGLEVNACNTSILPIIDGIEDAMWSAISSHKLEVTENGLTFPDTNDVSANYKIAWDATSLYFFIKVKDDILFADSPQLDFFRDDAVSIFIDATDNNSVTYDADDYYIGLKQGSNDIVINNALYTGAGVTKNDVTTAIGYDMEVKIDWSYLGITPTVGNDIGLDFRVDDDDNGGSRENHLLWNDETSTLWNNPSKFGVLKLSNTSCQNSTDIKTNKEEDLTIYPNPTNGELTIISNNEIIKIEVYNSLGSLVLSRINISAKSQELNIINLPKGVYSIKISTDIKTVLKQLVKL